MQASVQNDSVLRRPVESTLAADLHTELTRRLDRVTRLAPGKDTSVPAGRAYVEAMLGFQVYANSVHQALHREPHGEHGHG
jgi:hypothetical protein